MNSKLQFEINSAYRLLCDSSDSTGESDHWWDKLSPEQKKQYISDHPNSKYAKESIEDSKGETGDSSEDHSQNKAEVSNEDRRATALTLKKASSSIVKSLKHAFPRIKHAASILKNVATGQPLDEEQKEVLHELGGVALKVASSHLTGSPHLGKVLQHVGTHAVEYSIEQFKERKARKENANKDNVEVFVDGVIEGVENGAASATSSPKSPEKKPAISREQAKSVAQHVKQSAKHITNVLERSFKDIKPATKGLISYAQGKPLDEEHKKAVKRLGKVALATSIATLPGGLIAHLGAGVAASALIHAYKAIKGHKQGSIIHRFVESIGEGLEDSLLEHAAGEGE